MEQAQATNQKPPTTNAPVLLVKFAASMFAAGMVLGGLGGYFGHRCHCDQPAADVQELYKDIARREQPTPTKGDEHPAPVLGKHK